MQIWLPVTALSVALTISVASPFGTAQAMGAAGTAVHAGAGPGGHGFGFPRHVGFRHPFFFPRHPFRRPNLNFGAGFVSHQRSTVIGGYGDYNDAADDEYGSYPDDIGNLHFRVQEPFGPGDIGRPPVRAEEGAPYMPDRRDPSYGYAPDW